MSATSSGPSWQPEAPEQDAVGEPAEDDEEEAVTNADEATTAGATSTEPLDEDEAARTTAWQMEPVELPPDMELVETRPGATNDLQDRYVEEQQPAKRGRRPRPEIDEPVADEPLVQIETHSQPVNSAENR